MNNATTQADYLADRMMPVPDGCVLWTGPVSARGYGVWARKDRYRSRLAHAVVWELTHGPVPKGLELDHLCRVQTCVNTAHLEPVTHLVNVRRGDRPGRVSDVTA